MYYQVFKGDWSSISRRDKLKKKNRPINPDMTHRWRDSGLDWIGGNGVEVANLNTLQRSRWRQLSKLTKIHPADLGSLVGILATGCNAVALIQLEVGNLVMIKILDFSLKNSLLPPISITWSKLFPITGTVRSLCICPMLLSPLLGMFPCFLISCAPLHSLHLSQIHYTITFDSKIAYLPCARDCREILRIQTKT